MATTVGVGRTFQPEESTAQSLSHQLLNNHVKYVQRDGGGARLKLSPVSLESHSSELNQSRLFDSIQTASRAEEERAKKAEKKRRKKKRVELS